MQSMKRLFSSVVAISTILTLTAVPTWAEGLIGLFEGTRRCTLYDGTRERGRFSGSMGLILEGESISSLFLIDEESGEVSEHYQGFLIQDNDQPEGRAGAAFLGCDSNEDPLLTQSTVAAEITIKNNGGVTFKAQSTHIFVFEDPSGGDNERGAWATCRWNFKHVEDINPDDLPDIQPCN